MINELDYKEIKNYVLSNLDCSLMMDGEMLKQGLTSLSRLENCTRFINIVKEIKKRWSENSKMVPVVLCCSVILDQYFIHAQQLSDINVIRLADFSSFYHLSLLDKYLNIFSQEVFNELDQKENIEDLLDLYLFMIEDEYDRLMVSKSNFTDQQLILFVRQITSLVLNQYIIEEENRIEIFVKKEGIRF